MILTKTYDYLRSFVVFLKLSFFYEDWFASWNFSFYSCSFSKQNFILSENDFNKSVSKTQYEQERISNSLESFVKIITSISLAKFQFLGS